MFQDLNLILYLRTQEPQITNILGCVIQRKVYFAIAVPYNKEKYVHYIQILDSSNIRILQYSFCSGTANPGSRSEDNETCDECNYHKTVDSKSVSSHNPLQLIDSKLITQLWCFNNERMVEKQMSMSVQFGTANHRENDKCSYCINVTRFITIKNSKVQALLYSQRAQTQQCHSNNQIQRFQTLIKVFNVRNFPILHLNVHWCTFSYLPGMRYT